MLGTKFEEIQEQWSSKAEALTDFVLETLLNRDDAYSVPCKPLSRMHGATMEQEDALTRAVIHRHFRASDRQDLIGIHPTSSEKTSRWILLEIDRPQGAPQELQQVNEEGVKAYLDYWPDSLCKPLLIDSDGRGRFQLWVILASPMHVANASALGQHIAEYWGPLGLAQKPRVFPEHPSLCPERLPSRCVYLPGLHHTNDFYSTVWDGEQWLVGGDAVDYICNSSLLQPKDLELTNFNFDRLFVS